MLVMILLDILVLQAVVYGWIEKDMIVILLTNRTYPNRNYGKRISKIRAAVADVAFSSLKNNHDLKHSLEKAYVPYSKIPNTCIIQGHKGDYFSGVRIENALASFNHNCIASCLLYLPSLWTATNNHFFKR